MPDLAAFLRMVLVIMGPLLMITGVRHTLERVWPAHLKRERLHKVSLAAWVALFMGQVLATPALGGLTTAALNLTGGGLIVLPARGLGWWAGLVAYFLAMDLGSTPFLRCGPCTRFTTATAPSTRPRPLAISGWSRPSRWSPSGWPWACC